MLCVRNISVHPKALMPGKKIYTSGREETAVCRSTTGLGSNSYSAVKQCMNIQNRTSVDMRAKSVWQSNIGVTVRLVNKTQKLFPRDSPRFYLSKLFGGWGMFVSAIQHVRSVTATSCGRWESATGQGLMLFSLACFSSLSKNETTKRVN